MENLQGFTSERVVNGSFGEVWVNGDYMAELTGCEATVTIEYEDINQPRKLSVGKKMLGWTGEGSLTFNHVTSRFIKLLTGSLKEGKQVSMDIMVKIDDPDAFGMERINLKNCTFNDLTLANFQAKTKGEREVSFNFDGYEPLDLIER